MVVVMRRSDVPPAVTDGGLNSAVAPAGRPLAENVTVSATPLTTAVLTVAPIVPPTWTLPEVGETVNEKSFGGHGASIPATLTAVQAFCTVWYSNEHSP